MIELDYSESVMKSDFREVLCSNAVKKNVIHAKVLAVKPKSDLINASDCNQYPLKLYWYILAGHFLLWSGLSHPFLGMGPGPTELGKLAAF